MISNFKAKDAINKLSEYCNTHDCRTECAIYDACLKLGKCKPLFFGQLANGTKNSSKKWTRLDTELCNSLLFQDYLNNIFAKEANEAGLIIAGVDKIKCYPNGTIKVWYTDEDGVTVYKGKAKCHPNDAFNPEIGIKIAVQRIAEKLNKPFIPTDGEAYFYVDDNNSVYSTVNHNANVDVLNIAVGNCFKSRERAFSNRFAIAKRIERATELLKKLRDERDE